MFAKTDSAVRAVSSVAMGYNSHTLGRKSKTLQESGAQSWLGKRDK